ncbi:hypothetical protein KRP22_004482 [Phytophthora ramorum]|nr:Kinesin-like protein KIN-5A [Phytophthora ramorum]
MNEAIEVEVMADEGDSAGDMQLSSHNGMAGIFDSTAPSTAASTTDTIDSREEVHSCDEWGLFSDTDHHDVSEDEDSVDDPSDEEADPSASSCVDTDLHQSTTEFGIESALVLERSRQDDTDRQDSVSLSDDAELDLQTLPCSSASSDNSDDKNLAQDPEAEEDRPISRSEQSVSRRIQVVVRVRPPLDSEGKVVVTTGEKEGSSLCVQTATSQGSISTVTECAFDRVFMGAATQEDVFAAVEPSVQACLEGYNATVFAYGQTGTGKTHTLFGRDLGPSNDNNGSEGSDSFRMIKSSWGIVPRTLSYLLYQAAILKQKDCEVELHLSFLQIYNDRLFDLLTDRMRQKPLLIREQPTLDGRTSVTVQGLSSERVTSFSNAMQIIRRGHTNRCVRETESNLSSSRSHAIVQLHVTTQCSNNGEGQVLRKARLNLVDLAGSEKWNTDVEMEDAHSQELKNINTSLSALGNCIAALTEAGRKHIPYRDSTLTRVLQDSFGGNTQSCLIATVNATQQSCDETIRTLHFADRARSVMQTIRVNEVADGSTELLMAKIQIVKLRERLDSEQRRRHETRLKEHQALQRDFQDKLKGKDKEIAKLARDNAVFQRWREEDVKKIRVLESRVKDLEHQIDFNENRNNASLTDPSTSTPVQLPKRQSAIPASISMVKPTGVQKTQSRTNLTRVGSENGTAARTYKQVLERYALGANKGQQLKAAQTTKVAFQTQEDPSYDATNQLEDQPPPLGMSSPMKPNTHWETGTNDSRSYGSLDISRSTVTRYPASGLCVSPVMCPPNANDSLAMTSTTKNSWVYSNIAASMANFSAELTSSALSKSTPAILIQTQESIDKRHKSWPPNEATASDLRQEPVSLLTNATPSSLSYGFLPRPSAATAITDGSSIEPCLKHKLVGCMLCSVNESFGSTQAAPVRHLANESTASTCIMSKLNEPTRKTHDGPCERHQLLRCFICSKGGVCSASINAVQVATSASSSYSYNAAPSSVGTNSSFSYHSPPPQSETQSKCALHALANCILCAGVKAMTRKVGVPPPQASPAKSAHLVDTRSVNHGEERAADRYRRYTLDERILNHHTPKQVANQW